MDNTFEHNQIHFHYTDKGKGPALIFLHGLGASLQQAKEITSRIKGHRIVSMDFRGHGKTKRFVTASDAQMEVFAKDLSNLMEFLGIHECILGGLSLGAAVAMKYALANPEKIKKLVLVRPAWVNQRDPDHFHLLKLAHDLIQKYGIVTGREYFTESPDFVEVKEKFPNYAESLLGHFSRPQADTSYALLKYLPEDRPIDDLTQLTQLSMPVLVIGSNDDPLHPFSYAETIHSHLPNATLVPIISKYLNMEQHNRELQALMASFISS
ncbi:MAG: alpha/beta hydrolase [Lunatimonas sp.]|uniref:alpha/beta fold hydrolase n=1 Tax=Lunatimonas sp. TaxID=2060141 RepID=UPI00263B4901|nr:alpha/beta hydrolase [Lunatimonas sp.]MCC5938829.1 alpha/beta hydrolase [Lunatimonas sp.]